MKLAMCSFCKKRRKRVAAGPDGVRICVSCAAFAIEVIAEVLKEKEAP